MRLRPVRTAWRELHAEDPQSALGLSALYRLVAEGTIPCVKVGNRYLIDLDRMAEYIVERQVSEQ